MGRGCRCGAGGRTVTVERGLTKAGSLNDGARFASSAPIRRRLHDCGLHAGPRGLRAVDRRNRDRDRRRRARHRIGVARRGSAAPGERRHEYAARLRRRGRHELRRRRRRHVGPGRGERQRRHVDLDAASGDDAVSELDAANGDDAMSIWTRRMATLLHPRTTAEGRPRTRATAASRPIRAATPATHPSTTLVE